VGILSLEDKMLEKLSKDLLDRGFPGIAIELDMFHHKAKDQEKVLLIQILSTVSTPEKHVDDQDRNILRFLAHHYKDTPIGVAVRHALQDI